MNSANDTLLLQTTRAPLANGLSLLLILIGATLLGIAWWFPSSWISLLLSWGATMCLVLLARGLNSLRNLFAAGCIVQVLGFYWLLQTIHRFGDFPLIAAIPIFLLFVLVSALQFPLFGLLHRYLPHKLDRLALRAPIAWVVVEQWSIRIFPWHLGHTQIAFHELVQIADIVGSLGLSFLLIWVVEGLLLFKKSRTGLLLGALGMAGAIAYGTLRVADFRAENLPLKPLEVALVQGNIPLYRESSAPSPTNDTEIHFALTKPFDSPNTLVIWPETAVMHWTPAYISHRSQDQRLPQLNQAALITGILMFRNREVTHNSAIAIASDGTIGRPYHKRVLMPYGEYTPLSETFPWLLEVNNMAGNFVAGTSPDVHVISISGRNEPVRVGTLICYEDVLQSLAREAVLSGAEVLVNLSNDAWFGNSPALHQHHLIASFRAIENKRFHLRATNTGKTALVSPIGETIAALETDRPGALAGSITPIREITVFSRFGNLPWTLLSIVSILLALLSFLKRPRHPQ